MLRRIWDAIPIILLGLLIGFAAIGWGDRRSDEAAIREQIRATEEAPPNG